MDEASTVDLIRPYVLIALVIVFAGIVLWVFWPGRRRKYRAHAEIPLKDEEEKKE